MGQLTKAHLPMISADPFSTPRKYPKPKFFFQYIPSETMAAEASPLPPPPSSSKKEKSKKKKKKNNKNRSSLKPDADTLNSLPWSKSMPNDDPFSLLIGSDEGGRLHLSPSQTPLHRIRAFFRVSNLIVSLSCIFLQGFFRSKR